ncbi:3'-5' exonuclease [Rhizobium sp. P40RR-XXII]|uniref:exonuclease domain-containing protein n=1 Tax=Rhizobium sp. P40RR-XXII TaxID=2726739 RepID=UPI0014566F8D|nr:exonuclease domain-containing protein [Rhizobium sp. P40RR-XXII]NLS19860.1 3'-5' exonuclease [Rhizobium sp. P40RR-XXII]
MQKIRVVDFETTGFPEDQVRAICEVGFTDLSADWTIGPTTNFLVNPGHPIPPQTRAVHHISDADVVGAVSPDVGLRTLMESMDAADVFAAHNCKFEQAFFAGGGRRWICTMQCAKHLLQDAPGFSNQVLRYWMGLDEQMDDVNRAMPPHRAGPDTYVTALILSRLLMLANVDELVRLTTAPVLLRDVTFGKHKGAKWADLPWDYLNWVANKSDLGPDEKHTARIAMQGK